MIQKSNTSKKQNGLQMTEGGFKQFLEAVPDGLVIVNTQGKIQFVNKQVERMFGYPPEEMLGKPIELLIPERFSAHKEHREGYLDNLHIRPMGIGLALFAARKDGTEFQTEISLSPLEIEEETYIIAAIRDVTQQRLSEKQLKQSLKRYQQTVDNMLEGCQIIDFDWRYIYINDVAASQGRRKPEEMLMRTMMEVYPGIENTELFNNLRLCMEKRISQHMENRFENPDGITGWFEISAQPVPEGIFVLSINITKRKQAEESLLKSEKRFRALVEKSMEEVSMVGADGSLLFESPTTRRPLGYPPNSFHGQSIFELFHPDDQADAIKLLKQVTEQPGSQSEALFRVRHHNGSWRWMEGIMTNLLDEPAIQAIVINYRDVTERKQAEEALNESKLLFHLLIESLPQNIYAKDVDGRFVFANHHYCATQGRLLEEIVGKTDFELHPSELAEKYRMDDQHVIETGQAIELIEEHQPLDEKKFFVQVIKTPLYDSKGQIAGILGIFWDITERMQAEEEMRTRTDELRTLYELSRALADANDLDEILNQVNRHAVGSVHTTFARIALVEENHFVMRAVHPVRILDHDLLVGKRESVAMLPYCQHVLEQNKSVILRNDSQEVDGYERAALLLDFAQTLCLIPLQVGRPGFKSKQALGILILGETRSEDREPFTPAKILLSESIGDQSASAIRRMRLYEQTERHLQQISALREIDLTIASSSDLSISVDMILSQVVEQLSVDAAAIWLLDPASNMLEYSAGLGFHNKIYKQKEKPLRLGEGYAGRAALERHTIHISDLTAREDNPRIISILTDEAFISYYCVPLIAKGGVKGVLEIFNRVLLEPNAEWLGFLDTLAGQAAIAIDNATLFENLQTSNADLMEAYDTTLEGWSAALDLRDKETEGHTQRVTKLTVRLAESMGFNQKQLVQVRRGALLHDIGKMGVPDRILLKPDKLTDEEWEIMRKHPVYAYQLLKGIAYLHQALDIPYCHHEKWDGTGYPRRLNGEEIPFAARIFAVVDIYDALTSDRPYRLGWSREKTLEHIHNLSGTHLDPQVVEAFLKIDNYDE